MSDKDVILEPIDMNTAVDPDSVVKIKASDNHVEIVEEKHPVPVTPQSKAKPKKKAKRTRYRNIKKINQSKWQDDLGNIFFLELVGTGVYRLRLMKRAGS